MSFPGMILAGGRGSRMGGADKALLPLGAGHMLEHVAARLAPQVSALALNANDDAARFDGFGLPVVPDSLQGRPGPLAGVLAALDWAATLGADRVLTAAVDTPFFPGDLAARLQARSAGQAHPLVLAATEGAAQTRSSRSGVIRHPTFGLWPVALRDDLRQALEGGLRKVVLWTERHGGRDCLFPVAGIDPFFNVNTPEDLAKAEALL